MTDIISIKEAFERWESDTKPVVVEHYGDGDTAALSESWNDFTDALCKDGELTGLQGHYCPAYDEPMPDCDHEFILENMGVSFGAYFIRERPDSVGEWASDASHYRVMFRRGKNELETYFSMGSAYSGGPQMADVFHCLLMDSDGIEGNDFESWAADYGYDTDSRKAERTFRACQKTLLDLKRLFSASELGDLRDLFHDY